MNTYSYIRQTPGVAPAVALVALLTAFNLASAQPLQPEVLASFNGNYGGIPIAGLTPGNDGNFYGTTENGTIFKVTTNGVSTALVLNAGPLHDGLTLGRDGNFYGTAVSGGSGGLGSVFRMTPNGVLTTLVSFTGTNGAIPYGGLTLGNDGNLYGTTEDGGSGFDPSHLYSSLGTVFRVTPQGVLTTLVSFTGANGAHPELGLTQGNDGNFYGTTLGSGASGAGNGTVFRVTTNGALVTLAAPPWVVDASLTLGRDGNFYGTTQSGGTQGGHGSVFRLTTNGMVTIIASFHGFDGDLPLAPLTLGNDGNFYGTAQEGGDLSLNNGNGYGTVFKVTVNGVLTKLASFSNTNGTFPRAGLALGADGNFYGTTPYGGDLSLDGGDGYGTVFKVTTNGVLTTLFSFDGTDRRIPSGLALGGDGNFRGTTDGGGSAGLGTVFQATSNGTLTTLVSFSGTNGASPQASLTLGNDGNFYGTTYSGGSSNAGTVFKVTTNGALTLLASFANTNGANPVAALILGDDGNFYGTTPYGGAYSNQYGRFGTVFQVTTNGLLTTLVSFAGTNGAEPRAALALGGDGNFYGTTYQGGSNNWGTVFRVTTNGVLTSLYSFGSTFDPLLSVDGTSPAAGLTLGSDGNFYGTTSDDAGYGYTGPGTIFRVTTNGALTTLVSFAHTNGAWPYAGLTLGTDGNFYGTTSWAGSGGRGTVFQVTTDGVLTTLASFGGTNEANARTALTLGSDGNFYGTALGTSGGDSFGVIYRLRHGASIQSSGMTTNGFQLNTLNVGNSGWVVLDSSSDLTHWTPIQTNGTAAAQTFLDPSALTQSRQFYRVRQQ